MSTPRPGGGPDSAAVNEKPGLTAASALRLVRQVKEHFLNRSDVLAFKPKKWKGAACPFEPGDHLDAVLLSHFLGDAAATVTVRWVAKGKGKSGTVSTPLRVGTYTPDLGGLTKFAVVDLDGENHKNPLPDPLGTALQVVTLLKEAGLRPYLERSRSGKGWHVWVFFESPAAAALVRRVLKGLLRELPDLEVFPKGIAHAEGGAKVGTQAWLPMWSEAEYPNNWFHRDDGEGGVEPCLHDEFETSPIDLLSRLGEQFPAPAAKRKSAVGSKPTNASGRKRPRKRGAEYWVRWGLERIAAADGRNDAGFDLACQLRDNEIPLSEAGPIMRAFQARCCQIKHPYTEADAAASLEQAYGAAPREPWGSSREEARPVIRRPDGPPPGSQAEGAGANEEQEEPEEQEEQEQHGQQEQGENEGQAGGDVLSRLHDLADEDADLALHAATAPETLTELAAIENERPGEIYSLLRAIRSNGATSREVEALRTVIRRAAKQYKKDQQRGAVEERQKQVDPDAGFGNYILDAAERDGEAVLVKVGLPAQQIHQDLVRLTGGWPKRVGNCLFVPEDDRPRWLQSPAAVLAFVSRHLPAGPTNRLRWSGGDDMVTEGRFYEYLTQEVERYEAVEAFPHWPPLPGHYYMHAPVRGGDGSALEALVDRFSPAQHEDRDLILAYFLSLFWGGEYGARPAWMITAEENDPEGGRGIGKSTLPRMASRLLSDTSLTLDQDEKVSDAVKRLLSPEGMLSRQLFIDNLKTLKFSWGQLEGLITCRMISGHRLYEGEGKRPNTLSVVLTLNGASLSKDMAQRVIPIHLKRADYSATWEQDTAALIDGRRWEIIGDCIAALRRPAEPLKEHARWGMWEDAVLARTPDPVNCQAVIKERQEGVDEDTAESDIVREFFTSTIRQKGHDPDKVNVFFPAAQAGRWVNWATGERRPIPKACAYLRTLNVKEIRPSKDKAGGRGYRWQGKKAAERGAIELPDPQSDQGVVAP